MEEFESSGDVRIDWMLQKISSCFKLTKNKWKEFQSNEDNKKVITKFLNTDNELHLFFTKSLVKDELQVTLQMVPTAKKGIVIMKNQPIKIATDNYTEYLFYEEISQNTLKQLTLMLEELYLPMLKNHKNQLNWPKVVGQDIIRQFHRFVGILDMFIGQTHGNTILPIPPIEELVADRTEDDRGLVHSLESAVIDWTREIKKVIEKDNEKVLIEAEEQGKFLGPLEEIQFWKSKSANLHNLIEQLRDEKVSQIMQTLEKSSSTYVVGFNKTLKELQDALHEATDIYAHLIPLKAYFAEITDSTTEIKDIPKLFRPTLHMISMIWKECVYYSASSLSVLLKEISNDIITQIYNYIDPSQIWEVELTLLCNKLKESITTLTLFKQIVLEYKEKTDLESPDRLWKLERSRVFTRLDAFLERLQDILEIAIHVEEFGHLDKIDIGGLRGESLSLIVTQVSREFLKIQTKIQTVKYDLLDVKQNEFEKDFFTFCTAVKDFDKRLSYVISKGFENCPTASACFRLLESFEPHMRRDLIRAEVEDKYLKLLSLYNKDLTSVYHIFNKQKADPPIVNSLPRVSGSLAWCHALIQRISWPIQKIMRMEHLGTMQELQEVKIKYVHLIQKIRKFQIELYSQWSEGIEERVLEKMNNKLLERLPDGRILVNFDKTLSAGIQEVKYLTIFKMQVPDQVDKIFQNRDAFRKYTGDLNHISRQYNTVMQTLLPVERPLIEDQLNLIDARLTEATNQIDWNSDKIQEFIDQSRDLVKDLYNRLNSLKGNVKTIEKMIGSWKDLYNVMTSEEKEIEEVVVKPSRFVSLITFWRSYTGAKSREVSDAQCMQCMANNIYIKWKSKTNATVKQLSDIVKHGGQIHKIVDASREKMSIDANSLEWRNYVVYLNQLVSDGLYQSIKMSLQYLINSFIAVQNANDNGVPITDDLNILLRVKLELQGNQAVFNPDVTVGPSSIQERVHTWLDNVFNLSLQIQRLDDPSQSLSSLVNESGELLDLKRQVKELLDLTIAKMLDLKNSFLRYSYLWEESPKEYLQKFIQGKTELEDAYSDLDDMDDEDMERDDEDNKRSLEEFEFQIIKYEKLLQELQDLPETVCFGWLTVDSQPIRDAISITTGKWRLTFLQHLLQEVQESMTEFQEFVETSKVGLAQEVEKDDYEKLKEAMGYLYRIKERPEQRHGEAHFEPLKQTVQLLKKYEIKVPQDLVTQLDDAKNKWKDLQKLYFEVKDNLSGLQNEEIKKISKVETNFMHECTIFREDFLKKAPFNYEMTTTQAYTKMDGVHSELTSFEDELKQLREKQKLFTLIPNNGKLIKECRQDLRLLKRIWDLASLVEGQIAEWKNIPFLKIQYDDIQEETKIFKKELRDFDKKAKRWSVFLGIQQHVQNFMDTLPLVQKLRNDGMRDRHWKELMEKTGVQFSLSENFKLEHLLGLNLHKFSDDVTDIVDRATREMKMEKYLSDLDKLWSNLQFEFRNHPENQSIKLIKVPDEVVENLEDHQMQLQNNRANRAVDYFMEYIDKWLKTLGDVDTVLNLLTEAQKKWLYLENIFIGSDDIREQLPEDTLRFESVDIELKKILKKAEEEPYITNFCALDDLEISLNLLQEKLDMCENKLSAYLEEKKKAFPRFYFVSQPDLLDILSKGGQSPHNVMKHMLKLFQAIKTFSFSMDKDGNKTNEVIGIYSKEGEYVSFAEPFILAGKVEVWLQSILENIVKSLRHILSEAIQSYEEKPREEWLKDFPSQLVLVACQVYWTQEVNAAFEALEENNEAAMRNYFSKQIDQLNKLIKLVQGELEPDLRQKIMNLVTIDVHARDVVEKLIQQNVPSATAFEWQCQLRQRWDDVHQDCIIEICDAVFKYGYEYLGNAPRLVITPLTDRIYITLTQSLHLIMGGAPAGPAGTGKTETTKDLGSQLGKSVYVFNCSDQMDNNTLGDIFKGLASSGSWGCFDEFNRISAEVLSVVSTQFKSILDAIKAKKTKFIFETDEISLDPTVGAFITMNPGYLGRTELPESLKALFRPVTVVVPDLELICENMLMAEGFINAKKLAKKFITLYNLNRDLLSKQGHYDWGLRAIKSVLVVAGALKRADPDFSEDHILMRALRDFNLPKIVVDDLPVFMGLIEDLFPGIEVERKVDESLEKTVADVIVQSGWQAEDSLVLKVVQLNELLFVRHCVFIIGPAGAGKTVCWKSLAKAISARGEKVLIRDLNPKSITSHDLYGHFNDATGEWKNGLLSSIMKSLGEIEDVKPKWIILDGDLDTEWIESMNSVMDDNKILTLANNDRIPLSKPMRLIFEISHLHYATPATVSRAGILYISEKDIGWQPYVASWIDKRPSAERAPMTILFDRYVPECLHVVKHDFKQITPLSDFAMVQSLCHLLEGLITPHTVPNAEKEIIEQFFVFAAIWAFGGAIYQSDKGTLQRFDKWWKTQWKSQIKYPDTGTVFDCFFNPTAARFESWEVKKPKFEYNPEIPLANVLVPTEETTCIRYFLDMLTDIKKPVMLVGNAGTGKTKIVQQKLYNLDKSKATYCNINFNYYADSATLQKVMEQPLDKKGGTRYGPAGNGSLIYFIDDFNMPAVDPYGTQSPIALLRQHMDYNHWFYYDKGKWVIKDILQVQYVACMNPTAGSFTIDPRLQRHYLTFAVHSPSPANLKVIFLAILKGHLKQFPKELQDFAPHLVQTALALHDKIASTFQKDAINFYYEFNLRHLSNIFEGILRSSPTHLKSTPQLLRLWRHEATRVYSDRLSSQKDVNDFQTLLRQIVKQEHSEQQEEILREPLAYSHFTHGINSSEKFYDEFDSAESLRLMLEKALAEYNQQFPAMDLVLFEDAIGHICRISRIIEGPSGNALLIGVGGSGKQSLSRLAAFISEYRVYQIVITRGYGLENLKEDLRIMYRATGLKNEGTMFLLTDTQIVDERFLVFINDLLTSGNIPDLFPPDEKEEIANAVRTEAKSTGILDLSKENCWRFFIEKVKRNLHVVLCFSPVNDNFRIRSRKFPALVNCTVIDRFFPWPENALVSVAEKFLAKEKLLGFSREIVAFMAFAHEKVNEYCDKFKIACKRHTYTTPKSFLELIKLYRDMLYDKRNEIQIKVERLQKGIEKLHETTKSVAEFEKVLQVQQVEVEESKAAADSTLDRVSKERKMIETENLKASEEEANANQIAQMVAERKQACEEEFQKALPMLQAAERALDTLKVNELTELRSFKMPTADIVNVFSAVMVLLSPKTHVTKDRSWPSAQKMMSRGAEQFLKQLKAYNKDDVFPHVLKAIQPYLADENFNGDYISKVSRAAGGLCDWVRNIVSYYEAFCKVQPLEASMKEAEVQLAEAQEKLAKVKVRVDRLARKLRKAEAEFEEANQKKLAVMKQAENTQQRLDLAQRFVRALASENVRWKENIELLHQQENFLVGDVLLAAAFVSYIGSFDIKFREELTKEWVMKLNELKIPLSEGITPVKILTTDAEIAKWNNQRLPTDQTSTENGCILSYCQRWPLMIDPQLQGVTWIKARYGEKLKIVRLGTRGLLESMEHAIKNGDTVLVENIGETIDAVLAPILGRNIIIKNNNKRYMKLENEVEYNNNFKLIFHTKLSNPHYNPETQAETTLINFTVTEKGLEDQLLAVVVEKERQDLEQRRAELTTQQNKFKITLQELEDSLLENLNDAGEDLLGNVELIEKLEQTKETSDTIKIQVEQAKDTEKEINAAREDYRKVAQRGSLLYFLLDQMKLIQNMYQYSLDAFVVVFNRAILTAKRPDNLTERIESLIDCITHSVFVYTDRGLFERHKLLFLTTLCLRIMEGVLDPEQVEFLVKGPKNLNAGPNEFSDWLSDDLWAGLHALTQLKDFEKLYDDIRNSSKRWKAWSLTEAPEKENLPQDWKNKTDFQRLMVIRAMRPDRITSAMRGFVGKILGKRYTNPDPFNLDAVFAESRPSTPLFFILFPGADPIKDIEELGRKLGFSEENDKFSNISLGKGQEKIAEDALEKAYKNGGWVVLQNIHLMQKWLPILERSLESFAEGSHKDFRVFLSAEPSNDPIPQSILQSAIKITNEPPENLQANLERAFSNFSQEFLESSIKQNEFKTILFTLCFFHALVLGRRKFGFQGWSRSYSFNTGDLTISANVLFNYLEANDNIPWEDIRYIFGEIMYGGHITDKWDRRTCTTYLECLMRDELFEGMELAPDFQAPQPGSYNEYMQFIQENLPAESPLMFGLHPNAEIDYLSTEADLLFSTIRTLRGNLSASLLTSREEKVSQRIEELLSALPENFNMADLNSDADKKNPFVCVVLQECERMNILLSEIRRSLRELSQGINGELTISEQMDSLLNSLDIDEVPGSWTKIAYPSLRNLTFWFEDLLKRFAQLDEWSSELQLPKVVWLSGLFNPMSFLTAVMQATARKTQLPLDKMCLQTEVLKKSKKDITTAPNIGCYICGFHLEGAGWDQKSGVLKESNLKELTVEMPVIHVKAVPVDKRDVKSIYECPVYITSQRGPTYVFTAQLKTKHDPSKWILAGVALLLQPKS